MTATRGQVTNHVHKATGIAAPSSCQLMSHAYWGRMKFIPIWFKSIGGIMKRVAIAVLLATFALSPAMAQSTCQSKAVGKDGRPLAGAALNSFLTKCAKDTCEPKAIDKNGKPLNGAAKASFLKKCQSEA